LGRNFFYAHLDPGLYVFFNESFLNNRYVQIIFLTEIGQVAGVYLFLPLESTFKATYTLTGSYPLFK